MPAFANRPSARWNWACFVIVLGFAALSGRSVRADDPAAAAAEKRLTALQAEVVKALSEKRWEDVERLCREQIAIRPESETQHYNLACALARLGRSKEALAALKAAVDHGFFDSDFMDSDADLTSLRSEKAYADIKAVVVAREARAEEMAYEDAGQPVAGTRTVEGKPENGLRWRLRIGVGATAAKPHRLVVWLHPSGGSMNDTIEPLAKDLSRRGLALLVMTAKNWNAWNGRDLRRLEGGTLPDVAKVEGLDARRPILLGFSAGGQTALYLWSKDPATWGGIVLDAAYPIDGAASEDGRVVPIEPPTGDAKKATPMLVAVGDGDPGHGMWKTVESAWRDAGIPLTVDYVPDRGHEWLFEEKRVTTLLDWLCDAAAGKMPGAKVLDAMPTTPRSRSDTTPQSPSK